MSSADIMNAEIIDADQSEFAAVLRAEQIDFLMRQIPVLAAVNTVGGILLLSALWNEISVTNLLIWFCPASALMGQIEGIA